MNYTAEASEEIAEELYESILYKTPDPRAVALHELNPRGDTPAPPDCPGDSDKGIDPTLGLGLPDTFGKNFHPNELGHATIASFAIQKMMQLRAEALGQDTSCKRLDIFQCWQKKGSKGYASAERMNIK